MRLNEGLLEVTCGRSVTGDEETRHPSTGAEERAWGQQGTEELAKHGTGRVVADSCIGGVAGTAAGWGSGIAAPAPDDRPGSAEGSGSGGRHAVEGSIVDLERRHILPAVASLV